MAKGQKRSNRESKKPKADKKKPKADKKKSVASTGTAPSAPAKPKPARADTKT